MDIYANSKCTSYSCPTLSKTQKPFLTFHKTRSYTHEIGCEHSVRRRGPIHRARILTSSNMCFHITKYTYPIRQIPAFISLNTYLTIIKHVHSFHRTRIFTSPHAHFPLHFVGIYVYAGTINRTPTAANGLR